MTRSSYLLYVNVSAYRFLAYATVALITTLLFTGVVNGQMPFVTIWDTSLPGYTATNQIEIPGQGLGYSIYWEEEGNPLNNGTEIASNTHIITFPGPGVYRISITPGAGSFDRIMFSGSDSDDKKIISIESWGEIAWSSMASAFSGCSNMELNATDTPDLSQVKNMGRMFSGCSIMQGHISMNTWDVANVEDMNNLFSGAKLFNLDIGDWDVSNVVDMHGMFNGAEEFNQDIGQWDVSNVNDMSGMFAFTDSFNQNIGNWDVSSVTNFSSMFQWSMSFNQDIGNWDVSNATGFSSMFSTTFFNQNIGGWNVSKCKTTYRMFDSAFDFNQDLSNWNVSNIQDMELMFAHAYSFDGDISTWDISSVEISRGMFWEASSFNKDLSNWDVSGVQDMYAMFGNAASFNQDLNSWQLSAVTDITDMLSGSGLDCINYSSTLTGWATNPAIKSGLSLGADGLEYNGQAAVFRDQLIASKGWSINGDQYLGMSCSPCLENIDVDIAGPTYLCANESTTLSVQDTFLLYHWSTGEGNAALNVHNAGIYSITVTDLQGCMGIDSIEIQIIAAPIIEMFSNSPVCEGDTLMISAAGGDLFSWHGPDGFSYSFQTILLPEASLSQEGTYTVWSENSWGCQDSAFIDVRVNEIPNVTSLDTLFCSSENVFWVPLVGQTHVTYSLDNVAFKDPPIYGILDPGLYKLYLRDENNCSNNLDFRVIQGPVIEDLYHLNSDCGISEVSLEIIANGDAPLLYEISGKAQSQSPLFTDIASGLHFISVYDANGCFDTLTYDLVIDDVLQIINLSITPATCGDGTGMIQIEAQGDLPLLYSLAGLPFQTSNVFEGLSAGAYAIEVVDQNGCSKIAQGVVDQEFCRLFVPNAVSPNGDGINDVFAFHSEANTDGWVEMYRIYNRWGSLLYESYDFPLNSNQHWWDGTAQGMLFDPDVYVFSTIVRFFGQDGIPLNGEFHLMR